MICSLRATTMETQMNADKNADLVLIAPDWTNLVVNHRLQMQSINPKKPHLAHWHTGTRAH